MKAHGRIVWKEVSDHVTAFGCESYCAILDGP